MESYFTKISLQIFGDFRISLPKRYRNFCGFPFWSSSSSSCFLGCSSASPGHCTMDAKDIFGFTGICKDSPSRPSERMDGGAVREFPKWGKVGWSGWIYWVGNPHFMAYQYNIYIVYRYMYIYIDFFMYLYIYNEIFVEVLVGKYQMLYYLKVRCSPKWPVFIS